MTSAVRELVYVPNALDGMNAFQRNALEVANRALKQPLILGQEWHYGTNGFLKNQFTLTC